jgi:hypothetical protein
LTHNLKSKFWRENFKKYSIWVYLFIYFTCCALQISGGRVVIEFWAVSWSLSYFFGCLWFFDGGGFPNFGWWELRNKKKLEEEIRKQKSKISRTMLVLSSLYSFLLTSSASQLDQWEGPFKSVSHDGIAMASWAAWA